jgi:transcriptional antiterminator RfaH
VTYWACAQLEPNRERLALHCLQEVAGFTTYCPRIQARSKSRGTTVKPLFPGYAFVLIITGWWAARWSPGVRRIVLDGASPAKVPDAVISDLRLRESDGGVIFLPERELVRGDRVRILAGPFRDQLAILAGMKPHQRVEVLLQLLGRHQRVTLPKDDVEAVHRAGAGRC